MINFKKEIEKRKAEILSDFKAFISINTVYDEKSITKKAPYGKNVYEGFRFLEKLAKRDNFKYEEFDGKIAHLEYGNPEHKLISILGHLDTVPFASSGWKFPPLSGEIFENEIYGRGTQDDKGPMIACYHALKIIRDLNIDLKHKVRLIFGGDEERGSSCIKHYNQIITEVPLISFTPDSHFPVICAEKQMLQAKGEAAYKSKFLISLRTANKAFNIVPSRTFAVVKCPIVNLEKYLENYLNHHGLVNAHLKKIDEFTTEVIFDGVACHGSTPDKGENSFTHLCNFLKIVTNDDLISLIANKFYNDHHGEKINIMHYDEFEKFTSCSFNVATYENDVFKFIIDTRHPNSADIEKIKLNLLKVFNKHFPTIIDFTYAKGLYFDPKSKPIQFLLNCYKSVTHDLQAQPLAIGGGTYAKNYPNCVAYGMLFSYSLETLHNANERLNLDEYWKALEIYCYTLHKLLTEY